MFDKIKHIINCLRNKKKPQKWFGVNPHDSEIMKVNDNLEKIFPNSHIVFKLERSHDFRIDRKYIGVYIDDCPMSFQKVEYFNWNTLWIDIIGKFQSLKLQLEEPQLFVGKILLPKKHKY